MPAWRHIPRMTRTVIPAADAAALPSALSAYEAERAARIERNNAMLAALGVQQAAAAVVRGAPQAQTSAAAPHVVRHKRTASDAAPAAAAPPPVRVSKRQRLRKGLAPVEEQEPGPGQPHTPELADTDEFARLLTVDEYLERKGLPKGTAGALNQPLPVIVEPPALTTPRPLSPLPPGPLMNGHFAGWVEEGVRVQLGLAASAAVRSPVSCRAAVCQPADVASLPTPRLWPRTRGSPAEAGRSTGGAPRGSRQRSLPAPCCTRTPTRTSTASTCLGRTPGTGSGLRRSLTGLWRRVQRGCCSHTARV